jgi:imidazolonepropionase-like amidohydrolase
MTARTGSISITGGRVVPLKGEPIDGGTVQIVDGAIVSLDDGTAPAGTESFDASGKWVLPGFVEAHAHVGINEEGAGDAGMDVNEASAAVMPGVRALDAINIHDPGFRDALEGGVTTVVVRPGSANPIGGLTVAMKTWAGTSVDDQVMVEALSLKSGLGENPKTVFGPLGAEPKTRMGVAHVIRQAFEDARNYVQLRDAAGDGPFRRDLHMEALARALSGEIPWDVHAHRHDDIATALRIADEYGLRLIVQHGTESYQLADLLSAAKVPVIYGPTMTARSKVELAERAPECITTLAEAGVAVALTTDHPELPIEFLVHQAALAVKDGLSPELSLAAITSSPASIYALDDRVGALAPGMDGDVVIWSGDPLDLGSRVEQVFIRGVLVFDRRRSSPVIERSELD